MSTASQMAQVIDRWRTTAVNVPSHQSYQVAGHPVAWWFNTQNASTAEFMRALASDTAYVTPGNPNTSRLLLVFLRADRPMGRTLSGDVDVITRWISEGASSDLGEQPVGPLTSGAAGSTDDHAVLPLDRIDHVAITVQSLQRSYQWYHDVLGFEHFHKWTTTWMIALNSIRLGLFERPAAKPIEDLESKIAIQHFAIHADKSDFEQLQAMLKDRRISFEGPEDSGIAMSIFLNDPDGHQVEVTYYHTSPGYEGLASSRMPEYFHRLVNIEQYPDFLPYAKRLAKDFFSGADYSADENGNYAEFPYTPSALDERMERIYDAFVLQMNDVHWLDSGIVPYPVQVGTEPDGTPITRSKTFNTGSPFSNKVQKERLRQGAPFNLVDGAWLQRIQAAGPADEIRAHLFEIWDDEAGNGKVSQNHCNVYDALMRSLGFYLPEITSREFTQSDFLPGAFDGSVFQLCVGLYPEEFFPELLGMTLYLEWEATPTLSPVVRRLKSRKIDPHFYSLHVAIDNITAGHGFLAKRAIKLYLNKLESTAGPEEVQRIWKRIWNGYVTWATLGGLGIELLDLSLAIDLKQIDLSYPMTITEAVVTNLPGLHAKLTATTPDLPTSYLLSRLRAEGKATILGPLNSGTQVAVAKALFAELNVFIQDEKTFYDASRFTGVVLGSDVKALVAANPNGEDLIKLNRLLLRDTYAGMIGDIPTTLPARPWPDYKAYFRSRMEALVRSKAFAAKPVHRGRMLGGRDLGDLFDNPQELVSLLEKSPLVNAEHPRDSKFFELTDFSGPMYKIFTENEKDVILDWIESLGAVSPPAPPSTSDPQVAALAMKRLIESLADRARLVPSHVGVSFPDENGASVGLVKWFDNPAGLMAALKRAPGWVIPGDPSSSIFMQQFLGPMAVLGTEVQAIVRQWIQSGAEIPISGIEPKRGAITKSLDLEQHYLVDADILAKRDFARKRQFIGMGSVH